MRSNDDEKLRLDVLKSYQIIDTKPEQQFDDIALLASEIFKTPMAFISFVDEKRQWFKSKIGLDATETSRDIAFCSYAIYESDVFVVSDATKDKRFEQNPLVTGFPNIRFYAGAPLKTLEGYALGTICVVDQKPREISEKERALLNALARQVVGQIELHASKAESKRLQECLNATRIGIWEWDIVRNKLEWNNGMYQLYDMDPQKFNGTYDVWESSLYYKDKTLAVQEIKLALEGKKDFDCKFRIKTPAGEVRYIGARADVIFSANKEPIRMIGVNWDISQDVEKDLLLENVFNNSIQPLVVLDTKGKINKSNDAFKRLLKFSHLTLEFKDLSDFLPEDCHKFYSSFLEKTIASKNKSVQTGDFFLIDANSEKITVQIRVQLLLDFQEQPKYVLAFITDLTPGIEAKKAIKNSEEMFKKLFNLAPIGIFLTDAESNYIGTNNSFKEMLEYTDRELHSMSPLEIIHPEDIKVGKKILHSSSMVERSSEKIIRYLTKSKNIIWVKIRSTVLDNDDEILRIFIVQDITLAKKSEEDLHHRNETITLEKSRFESFFNALNESAIVAKTDKKGIITFANDKFCKVSGYSREELLGKSHQIINSKTHPKDFFKHLWKTISAGSVWTGEVCNRTKNGDLYWVDSTIVPLFDIHGNIEQYIAIRFEITKRKHLEASLIESREVEIAANKAKSEFLSNMSHEIRTPLNGIVGMSDLLKGTKLSGDQKEYVKAIISSSDILLELINDILDVSKIESGKMELEYFEFSLSKLINQIILPHQIKCKTKGIDFNLNMIDADICIFADEGRLGQIINNLLSNAIKFTASGNVELTVKNSSIGSDVNLLIKIQDSGIGMSREQQQKLFKAFSQAESSIARRYGGTGLGLSIVKNLTEMMRGTIDLTSELGKGTTFTINFTFEKSKFSPKELKENASEFDFSNISLSGKILVAEDNAINQNIIRKMLHDLGCVTVLVENGKQALEFVEKESFDLILLDCRMPEMDGYEASRAIRKLNKSILIIAMTANASEEDRNKCIESGMNDFISKPITKNKVARILSQYISKQDHQQEEVNKVKHANIADMAIIEDLMSMNTPDDPLFFEKQKKIFVDYSNRLLGELKFAVTHKDHQKISDIAHSIKGSSANLGSLIVPNLCKELENKATSLSDNDIDFYYSEVEKNLNIFYEYIDQLSKKSIS